MAECQRHQPEKTLLYEVVREQLQGFLAPSLERGHPAPLFIEQELRSFLRCGVLAHGFLRALFAELRRRARQHWKLRAPQCGAVTFVQRFGSPLNLNLHFHARSRAFFAFYLVTMLSIPVRQLAVLGDAFAPLFEGSPVASMEIPVVVALAIPFAGLVATSERAHARLAVVAAAIGVVNMAVL